VEPYALLQKTKAEENAPELLPPSAADCTAALRSTKSRNRHRDDQELASDNQLQHDRLAA
jgi:hypothetical protein